MNDLRYTSELIEWSDLLRLLEGATVNLNRPRNMFATDFLLDKKVDLPIFATGKDRIVHKGAFGIEDRRETEMMDCRWRYFEFTFSMPQSRIDRNTKPCTCCFATLVLGGSDDA